MAKRRRSLDHRAPHGFGCDAYDPPGGPAPNVRPARRCGSSRRRALPPLSLPFLPSRLWPIRLPSHEKEVACARKCPLSKPIIIIFGPVLTILIDKGALTVHLHPASKLERGQNLVANRVLDFPVGIPDPPATRNAAERTPGGQGYVHEYGYCEVVQRCEGFRLHHAGKRAGRLRPSHGDRRGGLPHARRGRKSSI